MTNPLYGSSISCTVNGWAAADWVLLATVTGNDLVKRRVTFPAYATDRIRVNVMHSADAYARLAEIEVWGQ